MGLREFFGLGAFVEVQETAPAPLVIGPSASQRKSAADHVARFERAIEQCEKPSRLAELNKWLDYYRKLAELEAGVQ